MRRGDSPQTVTNTVTQQTSGPPKAPLVSASPTYTSFIGTYFNIELPRYLERRSERGLEGSYFDTTIRDSVDPTCYFDRRHSGGVGHTDLSASASQVEQSLASQPGYRELRSEPTSVTATRAGWEFLVPSTVSTSTSQTPSSETTAATTSRS